MAVCCVGRGRFFSGRRKIRNFAFTMLSSGVLCDILMNESGSRSRFWTQKKGLGFRERFENNPYEDGT